MHRDVKTETVISTEVEHWRSFSRVSLKDLANAQSSLLLLALRRPQNHLDRRVKHGLHILHVGQRKRLLRS